MNPESWNWEFDIPLFVPTIINPLTKRQGVQLVTGMPGGANLPLYDALFASKKIRHVLACHEQGSGFIAQGMARVSGHPEVCFATLGLGVTNLLTAVADALLEIIPEAFALAASGRPGPVVIDIPKDVPTVRHIVID